MTATVLEKAVGKSAPVGPGIFYNVPDDVYRQIKALSKSELWSTLVPRKIEQKTLDIGNAFDLIVTQRHLIQSNPDVILCGPECDRRTKDGKATWATFLEQHPDSIVLTPSEFGQLRQMVASVKAHETLGQLYQAATPETTQVVLVWWDDEFKLWGKSKLDQVTSKVLVDWKTTSAADADEFGKSITVFTYHLQDEWYRRGWKALTGEDRRFIFACASKRPDRGHPAFLAECDQGHRRCAAEWLAGFLDVWRRLTPVDHDYKLRI